MNKITLALLIAKPGHLRNGLQSLLRTVPQIEILAESNDLSVLMKMEEVLPELIVVDGSLIDEKNWSALTRIKTDCQDTKVIVLTENDQQGQSAREAGADYYLLKGFRANELAQLIETSLITDPQDNNDLSSISEEQTEQV